LVKPQLFLWGYYPDLFMIMLSRANMKAFVEEWIKAWNRHDLDGVLDCMADDVVFEHWNGRAIRGKRSLQRAWQAWFSDHGNFCFEVNNMCIDQEQQSFSFEWRLEWPSPEANFAGQREVREGIDLIQLRERKVVSKHSYIKTVLKIGNRSRLLKA
jgi:hypothetical protein